MRNGLRRLFLIGRRFYSAAAATVGDGGGAHCVCTCVCAPPSPPPLSRSQSAPIAPFCLRLQSSFDEVKCFQSAPHLPSLSLCRLYDAYNRRSTVKSEVA